MSCLILSMPLIVEMDLSLVTTFSRDIYNTEKTRWAGVLPDSEFIYCGDFKWFYREDSVALL